MLSGRACLVVLGVSLIGLGGCGREEDSFNGVWTGAFRDSLGGLGGGALTLTQSGDLVQGSWRIFFQVFGVGDLAKFNNSGSLAGAADGDSLTANLMTSQGPCPFSLQATRTGTILRGTYEAVNCSFTETGSFDLELN